MRVDAETAKQIVRECNSEGMWVRCDHCFKLIKSEYHECLAPFNGFYQAEMISLGKAGKMIMLEREGGEKDGSSGNG